MKKHNLVSFSVIAFCLIFSLSTTAFAETIFHETMETFDYSKYLPIIVGGTLIIEAIIIMLLSDVKRIVNVSYSVLVANLVSFVIIRGAWGLYNGGFFYTEMLVFGNTSSKWIVAIICYAVSLVIELPLLVLLLRPFTQKYVRLMLSAAAANLVTTFAVTAFEIYLYNSLVS